jgi:hypothetical protein
MPGNIQGKVGQLQSNLSSAGMGRLAAQGILLDRSAVSRIEGQMRNVMDYEAAAIAKALKVPVAWFFRHEV